MTEDHSQEKFAADVAGIIMRLMKRKIGKTKPKHT